MSLGPKRLDQFPVPAVITGNEYIGMQLGDKTLSAQMVQVRQFFEDSVVGLVAEAQQAATDAEAAAQAAVDTLDGTVKKVELAAPTGAGEVGGASLRLSDVSALLAVTPQAKTTARTYSLAAYQPGWAALAHEPMGGGELEWVPTWPKNQHNGGSVIDPDKTFPNFSDDAQVAAWFTPAASGNGCFVRRKGGNDVTDFGAATGAMDATRCFKAWMSASKPYSERTINGRGHRLLETIYITQPGVKVTGNNASILYEGPALSAAFSIQGTAEVAMPVTAAIPLAAKTFKLSNVDAATLTSGDWVKLYSTENYFVAPIRDYKKGELVQVKSVAGDTVTIAGQGINLAYNAGFTITAQKLNLLQAGKFDGVSILGGGAANRRVLVEAIYTKGFKFLNGELGAAEVGARISCSIYWAVNGNQIHDINLAGTGYGVSAEMSSRNGEVGFNFFENNRHSFTTGGYDGVCMWIRVHGNHATSHLLGAVFNTHGNARFVTIDENLVDGAEIGASVYSPHTAVVRNWFRNILKSAVYGTEAGYVNCDYSFNKIGFCSESSFSGIEVTATATSAEESAFLTASWNEIEEATNGDGILLKAPCVIMTADNNRIKRFGYRALNLEGADHISARNNTAFRGMRGGYPTIRAVCTPEGAPVSADTLFTLGTTCSLVGNLVARGADQIYLENSATLILSGNLTNNGGTPRYTLVNVGRVGGVRGDIMRSPNGSLYRLTVGDTGALTAVTTP